MGCGATQCGLRDCSKPRPFLQHTLVHKARPGPARVVVCARPGPGRAWSTDQSRRLGLGDTHTTFETLRCPGRYPLEEGGITDLHCECYTGYKGVHCEVEDLITPVT